MTERGLPIVDGAPACPFVAFDDDRDERATSPDHRHRCYAEAQPAPRALAHQEAYCLSSAFPVCPTFQDWARREAALARPAEPPPADLDDEEMPPLVSDRPPRRDTRDVWAAPPPWLRGGPGEPPAGGAEPSSMPGSEGLEAGPAGANAAGPNAAGAGASAAGTGAAAAGVGGGLAGSFADRLASERASGGGIGPPAEVGGVPVDEAAIDEEAGDEDEALAAPPPPPRRRQREDLAREREEEVHERDALAPSWERPRRLEAYPTLRSRRLTAESLSPVLLGLIALVLAAAALFFLPSLLGQFTAGPGGSPAPSVIASAVPSASLEPTAQPAPTPFTYTVVQGDTLTKIAKRFGVSLADLIDANRESHPNPDVLKVGDVLIIPIPVPSEGPAASPAASG